MALHHLRRRDRASRGLAVMEVCFLVTVIGLLVAMGLLGMGMSRERSRRHDAVQNARNLGALFTTYAMDNDGHYPDRPTSTAAFNQMCPGKFYSGSVLYIPESRGKVACPVSSSLTAANVCWDIMGLATKPARVRSPESAPYDDYLDYPGIPTTADDHLPLIFNTGNAAGLSLPPPGGLGQPLELTLGPDNAFGRKGVIVLYKNMTVKFVKADPAHPGQTLGFMSKDYADPTPYVVRTP